MKPTWLAVYPKFDDYNIYLDNDVFIKHYCMNPKCQRLLTPCPDQTKLSSIKKLKADFVLLSSMNVYLCSDKFLSIITSYAKDDVGFHTINPNVNLLQINSTCTINNEFIDEAPLCPKCKITLSRTCERAFDGNKSKLFKHSDNESSLICRSKITMRDSSRASYDLFVRDILAVELKKIKCFVMLECLAEAQSD